MYNIKHTPAPWEGQAQGEANEYFITNSPRTWVANVRQNGEFSVQEQEANAKLIAAAPELLQELINIKECLKRVLDKYNPDDPEYEWVGEAHEVILKATL